MSNPKTTGPDSRWWYLVGLGLLVGYAAWLTSLATPVAGGSDSAGYLTSAQLITEGRLTLPLRTIPELPAVGDEVWSYQPLGMVVDPQDMTLRPSYPIGFPMHLALATTVAGWHWGPILVNVLGALGAALLTYGCARELGASRAFAIAAAATLAFSPVLVFTAIQPLSDPLATMWSTAAFYCALRARRTAAHKAQSSVQHNSRHTFAWSVGCGVAVSLAVLVRPTNVFLVPVLVLVLEDWRLLAGAGAGGLPGALFLGWYQSTLYGAPWATGYGDVSGLFSTAWIAPTLAHYAVVLPVALPAVVGAVLLIPLLPWRHAWRECTALFAWFLFLAAFFSAYYCTHESLWYLRFVMPGFPGLAILAALGVERGLGRLKPASTRWIAPACAAALVLSVAHAHRTLRLETSFATQELQRPYRELSLWAGEHLPPDAVVLSLHASCSLYFYTEFPVIRSDLIGAERFRLLRERLRASGRPTYALLHAPDNEPRRQDLIPGDWREIRRDGAFSLWELQHSP